LFLLITGKLNRGLSVVDSYKLLKGADDLSEEEMFLASTLGWCIEWVILSSSSQCYSAE
jgi:farnesyl diphosphate synthase